MIALFWACLSMALRDLFATVLVVAEARGRSWLAGAMDAVGDLAIIFSTIYGAGFVIRHGWTPHAIVIVGAMVVVSFFGTTLWTSLSRRISGHTPHKHAEVELLQRRVTELESRLEVAITRVADTRGIDP